MEQRTRGWVGRMGLGSEMPKIKGWVFGKNTH